MSWMHTLVQGYVIAPQKRHRQLLNILWRREYSIYITQAGSPLLDEHLESAKTFRFDQVPHRHGIGTNVTRPTYHDSRNLAAQIFSPSLVKVFRLCHQAKRPQPDGATLFDHRGEVHVRSDVLATYPLIRAGA